jgi:hypothetical protein
MAQLGRRLQKNREEKSNGSMSRMIDAAKATQIVANSMSSDIQ